MTSFQPLEKIPTPQPIALDLSSISQGEEFPSDRVSVVPCGK